MLAFVLILTALVMPGAVGAQGGTLDQSNDGPANDYAGDSAPQAQTFTADALVSWIGLRGAGNDTMLGGPGADKLNGASGTDSTPDYNASEGHKRTNVP